MATTVHLSPFASGRASTRGGTPDRRRPLHGLAQRRARNRMLFAAGYFALASIDLLTAFMSARPVESWGDAAFRSFYSALIDAASWWSCITVAERWFEGSSARTRYSAAALLAAAGALFLHWLTATALFEPSWERATTPAFLVWWQMVLIGLWRTALVTAAYAFRMRLVTDAVALDSARLERALRSRQRIESELQAMQSHIEPAFLFEALDDIERACDGEPARADAILDRLVDYLRAVLPNGLETPSTVSSELDVMRAHVALLNARGTRIIEIDVEATPSALTTRVPPMLLLPLAQRMSAGAPPPERMLVACESEGSHLRIAVETIGGTPLPNGAFADVARRLEDVFGYAAHLSHARTAQGSAVTLTLPALRPERRRSPQVPALVP